MVLLAKRIPSEHNKMECNKQTKFPSWGCGIAEGRHWEKQMTNCINF